MKGTFSGEVPQEQKPMTMPGTIAVFEIVDVKFGEKNDKEYFEMTFERKEDSFREWFYMTEKAQERLQYFADKVIGRAFGPNDDENNVIAAFKGKKMALKVGGSVSKSDGKGYPSLTYLGFARKPEKIEELAFSGSEQTKVDAAIAAMAAAASSSNGSSESSPAPANDDEF